jgi:RNA recognition motif-containing protein
VRPIRITGNIFVTNLPTGFTDARLAELFDNYGLVLSAYLARDPDTGATRNHGLVDLAPASAMLQAIEELNGSDIEGQRIAVRSADPDLALRPPRSRHAAEHRGRDHHRDARDGDHRAGDYRGAEHRDQDRERPPLRPMSARPRPSFPAAPAAPRPAVIVERRPLARRIVRPVE